MFFMGGKTARQRRIRPAQTVAPLIALVSVLFSSPICDAFPGGSPLSCRQNVNYIQIQPQKIHTKSIFEDHESAPPFFQPEAVHEQRQGLIKLRELLSASLDGARTAVRQGWWCFPMFLALVPVYCALVLGTSATMPSWWPCVRLEYLRLLPYAKLILGVFLLSNLSYFMTGLYFWTILPRISPPAKGALRGLGTWIVVAGAVSTIFHSVQALGPHAIAESLCYIDHGVAMSAGLFFWFKCGPPSRTTLVLGAIGLATLAVSGGVYPWLHSVWHLLSSVVAVVWAQDGIETRV